MVTRGGENSISDLLFNRTQRSRPGSEPIDFKAHLINNTCVELQWGPPVVPNGPIDFYQVRYGFQGNELETEMISGARNRIKIPNLRPYSNYSVELRACTSMLEFSEPLCGHQWADLYILTGIGGNYI